MIPSLSLSAGGGGPSGASANNGVSLPNELGFNFDHSSWVINNKSSGSTSASGNKDANQQSQIPQSLASGLLGGTGLSLPMLLIGGALFLMLRHH
jgi:hypothetical protein